MLLLGGCTPKICSERSLIGFLVCDPEMVEEPTKPQPRIRLLKHLGDRFDANDFRAGDTLFAGSVPDDDPFLPANYIAREEWDIDPEPGFEFSFPYAGSSVSRPLPEPGFLNVRLRVTDQEGNFGESERSVEVQGRDYSDAPGPRFSLRVDPNPARVGELVGLSVFPAEGSVDWDLDGEPGYETVGGDSHFARRFFRPGEYPIRARVTDADGHSAEDGVLLVVQGGGGTIPPVASFSARPNPAMPNELVRFDRTGSYDPDGGDLVRWEWDIRASRPGIDVDQPDNPGVGDALRFSTTYDHTGFEDLLLRVTDDDGDTGEQRQTLQLDPEGTYAAPEARITASPNPASVRQPVTLDASGSTDADGSIVRYQWDLVDDTRFIEPELDSGSTSSIVYSFDSPSGESGHLVRVIVTDDDGREDIEQVNVRVRDGESVAPSRTPDPIAHPAAAGTTNRLFARLDLPKLLSPGKASKNRLKGVRLRGRIAGKLLKPNGEEATASPAVLGRLLKGRWNAKLDLTKRGDAHSLSGLALATAPGRRPARACLRLKLATGTPANGRTPITGSFRVLGGDRSAARLRASGRIGLEIRPSGYAVAAGTVTSSAGKARKMPAACRRLAR